MKRPKTALVSVHDVTPENLTDISEIICFLKNAGVKKTTLLIITGRNWQDADIKILQKFQKMGIDFAGHGWTHQSKHIRTFQHRLHKTVISRNEAEHLSLDACEINQLIHRSYQWFEDMGLILPRLYVPPAWAMGRIQKSTLSSLPFEWYEYQSGVFQASTNTFFHMPVTGYMADTRLRSIALKVSNTVNCLLPHSLMRISIHPDDLKRPLKPDIIRHLSEYRHFSGYSEIPDVAFSHSFSTGDHQKQKYQKQHKASEQLP